LETGKAALVFAGSRRVDEACHYLHHLDHAAWKWRKSLKRGQNGTPVEKPDSGACVSEGSIVLLVVEQIG
jgi:hypothetical protein